RFRPARGDDLSGAASPRAGRPAFRALGDRRFGQAAPGLRGDAARPSRARPAASGVGALLRRRRRSVSAGKEAGVIPEYVELLARELDFDPSLSQRVCREVADHLWEAVSADPSVDRSEAERQAVLKFGDPRAIAAQFAVVSLARRARRMGVASV